MRTIRLCLTAAIIAVTLAATLLTPALAEEPAGSGFLRTWQRTDWPVLSNLAARTWVWGPEAFTGALVEPYSEAPNGQRIVQYYDKSRMEITFPDGDRESPFFVTNGLLVVELVTGAVQLGDDDFEQRAPAAVNVAGDADDPEGPTYESFADLLDAAPLPLDQPVTQTLDRAGNVGDDPALSAENVQVALVDEVTGHAIAAPFWAFMTSSGPVVEDGDVIEAGLFENPYFATGRPISEAYWAAVRVGGEARQVLVQCFERRCLTYTPGNPPGFVTEAGNVGRHYYSWRYGADQPDLAPQVTIPTQASWQQVATGGEAPATRRDHSLAADSESGTVYLFGGRDGETSYGDLWAFDVEAGQWTQLAASGAGPDARFGHNAVFDRIRKRVIVYGGEDGSSFFNDVWAWDFAAGGWSQTGPTGGPPSRYGGAGAYDALTNSLIISHGIGGGGRLDDTWRFDLTSDTWANVSPSPAVERPEARCLVRGVADPNHGRLLIFGGQSNTASHLGDLWSYDLVARSWTRVESDGPTARNLYAATAGEDGRYLLLHGGNAGDAASGELWLLDYATLEWIALPSSGGAAPALIGHDAVWIDGGTLIVVGGGETWVAALSA